MSDLGDEFARRVPLFEPGMWKSVCCCARTRAEGVGCREVLARVIELPPGKGASTLSLPTGFHPGTDGVWRLSSHALQRYRNGKGSHDRRPGRPARPSALNPGGRVFRQSAPTELPFQLECPSCHHRRTIDAAVLGLEGVAHPG